MLPGPFPGSCRRLGVWESRLGPGGAAADTGPDLLRDGHIYNTPTHYLTDRFRCFIIEMKTFSLFRLFFLFQTFSPLNKSNIFWACQGLEKNKTQLWWKAPNIHADLPSIRLGFITHTAEPLTPHRWPPIRPPALVSLTSSLKQRGNQSPEPPMWQFYWKRVQVSPKMAQTLGVWSAWSFKPDAFWWNLEEKCIEKWIL